MKEGRLAAVEDEAIAALGTDDRRFVAESCARRAELELRGGAAFTMVTQALFDLGAEVEIVSMSARAVEQEIQHARIYLDLAAAYAGAPVPAPAVRSIRQPVYPGASAALQAALRVIAMCAINETMACAFLELCREGATSSLVRAGLRRIIADEIHHAQIGWAFLGSARLRAADRARISPWLVTLLETQLAGWRTQIAALPARALPEHGCPSPAAVDRSALEAMRDLVLPGLERAGLDVGDARAWFAARPPAATPTS